MDSLILNGNNNTQWKRLDSNDNYVFSRDILQIINKVESPFDFIGVNIINDNNFVCDFKQNVYLGLTYDFIYSNETRNIDYHDAYGKVIKFDESLLLSELKNHIINNSSGEFNTLLFSNIIDILIDKGLITPNNIHNNINPTIIRAYKYGEVYSLNESHFKLFTYALCEYLKGSKKDRLKKTEFEKLCVLFFKEVEKGILDYSKASGAEDEYSICYSKFGPRVSTSKPIYSADKDSTLASKLITLKLIDDGSEAANKESEITEGVNEKEEAYEVTEITEKAIEKQEWIIIAQAFSIRHAHLYSYLFVRNGEKILFDEVRNMYMRTYIEFLIMLSIGLNKKNQLLSLLAELYLVDTTEITKGNIKQTLKDYCRILDGLISGMWKYMCYNQPEHPLLKIYNNLRSDHKTELLSPYIADIINLNIDTDKNELIEPMIEKAGKLIFSIFYSIWFMLKKHGIKYYEHGKVVDLQKTKTREFYYNKIKELRKTIEEQIQSNNNIQDLQTLYKFKLEAKEILECYDIKIARGKKHDKNDDKRNGGMGTDNSGITINVEKSPCATIHVSGNISNSQLKTENISFESISDELIEKLDQLLLRSEDKDKEALNNAIIATKKKDEKGFLAAMRTVGKITLDIIQNVVGNVICEYLRQKGILPS
jgi:hypothetical protein